MTEQNACNECGHWDPDTFNEYRDGHCAFQLEENRRFNPVSGVYYRTADHTKLNKDGRCPHFSKKVSFFQKIFNKLNQDG